MVSAIEDLGAQRIERDARAYFAKLTLPPGWVLHAHARRTPPGAVVLATTMVDSRCAESDPKRIWGHMAMLPKKMLAVPDELLGRIVAVHVERAEADGLDRCHVDGVNLVEKFRAMRKEAKAAHAMGPQ